MPSTEYGNALELARQVDAFFEADTAGYMRMFTPRVPEFRVAAEHMYPYGATEFVERYGDGVTYPVERLVPLVERATDIRLQLWYIMYDLGLSNRDYYDVINADASLKDSPRLIMRLMALDQNLIGRSRIAWERLMRFVYFLETGTDLTPSGNRSYKAKFFAWVENQSQWLWLAPYNAVITKHDQSFRTGEFHKGSVLRPRILGRDTPKNNDFLPLSNYMRNGIWPNILQVVSGEWASHFTDLHQLPTDEPHGIGDIDPKYLRSS